MSDHIDGPRQIGDPSADLSDLFAFTSPENPARTVLAACVFRSAGTTAMFSNAVEYAFAIRRVTMAGLGDAAKFEPGEEEIRLSCRFDNLKRGTAAASPVQCGTCILPDGLTLPIVVNDEKGTSTPDGVFRVFAGMRSDPFYLSEPPLTTLRGIGTDVSHGHNCRPHARLEGSPGCSTPSVRRPHAWARTSLWSTPTHCRSCRRHHSRSAACFCYPIVGTVPR
jgi:hypothetical protein